MTTLDGRRRATGALFPDAIQIVPTAIVELRVHREKLPLTSQPATEESSFAPILYRRKSSIDDLSDFQKTIPHEGSEHVVHWGSAIGTLHSPRVENAGSLSGDQFTALQSFSFFKTQRIPWVLWGKYWGQRAWRSFALKSAVAYPVRQGWILRVGLDLRVGVVRGGFEGGFMKALHFHVLDFPYPRNFDLRLTNLGRDGPRRLANPGLQISMHTTAARSDKIVSAGVRPEF
ncbi:hypothetical protein BJ322DRAFT_1024299 [Thelephora terrestris]|uniref:Uncharacterized protein n=1 Tax=Thelephora terrestris TaxID=56493 RepID=A0A9P6H767_9AGAM|nr:hypothetical protein BJ322DRAFT_1024299 [Thelephora terrestris]